jgi:hypothetical protein
MLPILSLLYRRFYGYADSESLKQLYLTMVRPHLDLYVCQSGIPTWSKTILRPSWRKYRSLPAGWHLVDWMQADQELLEVFELSSPEEHRLDFKLGLSFKILH